MFFYESSQLVILNVAPLTAFIVASPTASTYSILKLREQLEPLLQDIENIVPDIPGGKSCLMLFSLSILAWIQRKKQQYLFATVHVNVFVKGRKQRVDFVLAALSIVAFACLQVCYSL